MNKSEIGVNAGLIWETLDEKGPMLFTELEKQTALGEKPLIMALGWLAREDKIYQANPFEKEWEIYLIYN